MIFQHKYDGVPQGKKYWAADARLVPLQIPATTQPGTTGGKLITCEYWVGCWFVGEVGSLFHSAVLTG